MSGPTGSGNGQFSGPQGIAVDANNNVWVADSGNNRVEELSPTGGFFEGIWLQRQRPRADQRCSGDRDRPFGQRLDQRLVEQPIDEFTSSGTFVRMFGSNGSGPGQFAWLGGITTDSSGNVFVADANNNRVQEFPDSGAYVQSFGSAQLSFDNDRA